MSVAAECVDQVTATGHRSADLQRTPNRVVSGLAARNVEHVIQIRHGFGVVGDVGDLADRKFDPHRVIVRPGPRQRVLRYSAVAHHLLGPHQAQIGEQGCQRRPEPVPRS